jgi:hypothetical protein
VVGSLVRLLLLDHFNFGPILYQSLGCTCLSLRAALLSILGQIVIGVKIISCLATALIMLPYQLSFDLFYLAVHSLELIIQTRAQMLTSFVFIITPS